MPGGDSRGRTRSMDPSSGESSGDDDQLKAMHRNRLVLFTAALLGIALLVPGGWARACLHGMACADSMPSAQHCNPSSSPDSGGEEALTVAADCCGTVAGKQPLAPEAVTSPGILLPSPEKTVPTRSGLTDVGDLSLLRPGAVPERETTPPPWGRELLRLHQVFLS